MERAKGDQTRPYRLYWEEYLTRIKARAQAIAGQEAIRGLFHQEFQAFFQDEYLGRIELSSLKGFAPYTLKRTVAEIPQTVDFELRATEPLFTVGFLFAGRFSFLNDETGEAQHFEAPQVLIYHQRSSQVWQRIEAGPYETLNIALNDQDLEHLLERLSAGPALRERLHRTSYSLASPGDDYLGALFNQLNLIPFHRQPQQELWAEGIVLKILHQSLQWLQREGPAPAQRDSRLFYQILEHLRNHLHENLSAEGVQRQFGVTKNWLQSRFERELQSNFSDYLRQLRLRRAYDLLQWEDPPMSVKEICQSLGFRSSTSFSSLFKSYYGLSPKALQKKSRLA